MRVLFFLLLSPLFVFSQKTKSDTLFEFKYFKNGKISTKKAIPKGEVRFGYFKAYKLDGTEIYNMSIRNVGGHSSVDATYFPNGAISTAHYTGQPDGGIQHEDVTHYFDELGNVTNVVDLSDDGHTSVTIPDLRPSKQEVITTKPEVKKEQVVACAVIYSTEIYVVNFTRKQQTISTVKSPSNGFDFKPSLTVDPGDTIKVGMYVEAQMFTAAENQYSFEIKPKKSKKMNTVIGVWDHFIQSSPERRIYYLLLVDTDVK